MKSRACSNGITVAFTQLCTLRLLGGCSSNVATPLRVGVAGLHNRAGDVVQASGAKTRHRRSPSLLLVEPLASIASLLRSTPPCAPSRMRDTAFSRNKRVCARSTDLRSHLLPETAVRALQHERAPTEWGQGGSASGFGTGLKVTHVDVATEGVRGQRTCSTRRGLSQFDPLRCKAGSKSHVAVIPC